MRLARAFVMLLPVAQAIGKGDEFDKVEFLKGVDRFFFYTCVSRTTNMSAFEWQVSFVGTLGRVVIISFFVNAMATSPIPMSFGTLIPNLI